MEKTEDSDAVSEVKHKHDDLLASLDYEHIHQSIVYVTMRLAKSTHQQVISQQSTQNTTS